MTKKPYATRTASIEIRQKIMDFITEYRKKPPFFQSPTMQQIADALLLSKTSVYHHLVRMEKDGKILRSHSARGIVPAIQGTALFQFGVMTREQAYEASGITPEPLEDIHARVKQAVKCSRCDGTGVWNYYDNATPCPDCNKRA